LTVTFCNLYICHSEMVITIHHSRFLWKRRLEYNWHFKDVLHATSRRSLLHCHPRTSGNNVNNIFIYLALMWSEAIATQKNAYQQWHRISLLLKNNLRHCDPMSLLRKVYCIHLGSFSSLAMCSNNKITVPMFRNNDPNHAGC
jgi:hypothetical protein